MRNTEFEMMVRSLHGDRYSFELDQEGFMRAKLPAVCMTFTVNVRGGFDGLD